MFNGSKILPDVISLFFHKCNLFLPSDLFDAKSRKHVGFSVQMLIFYFCIKLLLKSSRILDCKPKVYIGMHYSNQLHLVACYLFLEVFSFR